MHNNIIQKYKAEDPHNGGSSCGLLFFNFVFLNLTSENEICSRSCNEE